MGRWEELRRIVASDSLLTQEGGYVLASGKWSPYYFDLKLTTLSNPYALSIVAEILLERVRALPGPIHAVGGLTLGADPLVIAVSLLALQHGWTLPAFFVRDEQKSHGTERVIEGTVSEGMNVVILDDVITTGRSVLKAIGPVEKQGAKVAHVLVLVDREEGGLEDLRARGYSVEPIFRYSDLKA